MTSPGIYLQVYHRTLCPAVLIFVRGLIKNKGGVGLFQISQKKRLFHLLYQPSDNIVVWSLVLYPSKKGLSFPFSLGKERIYLETQLEGELTDLFSKLTGCPCSHRQSRNRMMNTFIIVNITPICR